MRRLARCLLEGILVSALFSAQIALAQTTFQFDLPAQPLADALRSVGRITNTNVLFDPPLTDGVKAPALRGKLSAEQAFAKLLEGTSLKSKSLDDKTVTIARVAPGVGSTNAPGDSAIRSTTPGVVNANKSSDAKEASANSGPPVAPSGATKDPHQNPRANETGTVKTAQLEEIVVTGSRIPLTAGQHSVQPVRSYTREDIANSGQSTVGEFLNTLPDVSNFTPSYSQFVVGAQSVQLHGLPVGTTLTLLNGRRVEAGSVGFFDLSNIPVSAVERVEILPVGASAIYGADALAGAVNFILRKDFNGFEVNATLDHAADVNDPSVDLAWGKAWGRGSVSLIASYENRGELLGTQRAPTSLSHFPVSVPTSTALALGDNACAPGNVYSIDGSSLPGLSSPQAGIPAGVTGTLTIGQFAATAGKLNVCNAGQYADITPRSQRENALLSAHFELVEAADLFTEILFSHRHSQNQTGPQISVSQFSGPLSANNPFNPFGQDVNVSFAYPGTGQRESQFNDLIRPTIGVRGTLFSDWYYEAIGTFSRNRVHQVAPFPDPTLISAALVSSDPATALNPFVSGAPGSPQLLSSLSDPAIDTFDSAIDDQLVTAQAILRGPVAHLPAGAVQAVMGSDWSHEEQRDIYSGIPPIRLHRKAYAVFSETRVPLLAGRESPQANERLTLTLAGRYDHSEDYGGKATWQGGLLWRATAALSFNGSFGQSYQAPQLGEISGPQTTFSSPLFVTDPFRGNELSTYPVTQVGGPNYNLRPETGSSSTVGLMYTGETLPGLHASITWYDLAISNYIGFQTGQVLVDNPNLFPGAVVRAPATAQDLQQGFLGVITQVNNTSYNFGDLRVRGADADMSYAIDTPMGQFTPSLAIANIYKWTSALLPGTPAMDAASKATFTGVGWAPRWKGTVALAWKRGPLSMNVAGRYVGRYLDYQDYVPNTNEIGNSWIVDAGARYEVGEAFAGAHPRLAHAYIALSAVNLLNKTPPFSNIPYWYDFKEYDIRGRFLHLSVGMRL